MEQSKVIDKIKKCLALAQSSNPNESATAFRQAHALMEKYGITERQAAISDITVMHVMSEHQSKIPLWAVLLVRTCAYAFQCEVVFRSVKSGSTLVNKGYPVGTYSFYGTEQNVDLASYAYEQLTRAHQNARKSFEETLPELQYKHKRMELKSFSTGWAESVARSVKDFAESFREGPQFALIQDAIKTKIEIINKSIGGPAKITKNGYAAGQEEGSKVTIRTGLGGKDVRLALN